MSDEREWVDVSSGTALDIHTVGYEPLNGSSWVPLPKFLASKKAIINMENTDNQCFKWCIARVLNPAKREIEKRKQIGSQNT